jgi:LmbE family N-acetylglucosaminyl deacetylase
VQRLAAQVGRFARAVNARRLFCTWAHDPHPDHLATAALASLARRAAPRLHIAHYPIWGRFMPPDIAVADRHWIPLRFDARPWLPAKRAALNAYRSQTTRLIGETAEGFLLTPAQRKAFLCGYEIFLV